jgi:hypothetical protein
MGILIRLYDCYCVRLPSHMNLALLSWNPLAPMNIMDLWLLHSLIQKCIFFFEAKFEFPQFFSIASFFSAFSQQTLNIGLWEVRPSGFPSPLRTLITYNSLFRLILNELFLHLSIWTLPSKFMAQNYSAQMGRSRPPRKSLTSQESFWMLRSILSDLKISESTINAS